MDNLDGPLNFCIHTTFQRINKDLRKSTKRKYELIFLELLWTRQSSHTESGKQS